MFNRPTKKALEGKLKLLTFPCKDFISKFMIIRCSENSNKILKNL